MTTATLPPAATGDGRRLVLLGVVIVIAGIAAYAVQLTLQRLFAPWYLPCTGALGVVLLMAALWRRRRVGRAIILVLLLLVLVAEVRLAGLFGLPAYTGPVLAGRPFPVFVTQRADGSAFTQRDLAGPQRTVMVFFRGRW